MDTVFTIRIPSALLAELDKATARRSLDALSTRVTTRSDMVRTAIAEFLKREAKKG